MKIEMHKYRPHRSRQFSYLQKYCERRETKEVVLGECLRSCLNLREDLEPVLGEV